MDLTAINITVNMVEQYILMRELLLDIFHIVILQEMVLQRRVVQYMLHPIANSLILKDVYSPKIRLRNMVEEYILILNLQP
jgi:hypothetical protein